MTSSCKYYRSITMGFDIFLDRLFMKNCVGATTYYNNTGMFLFYINNWILSIVKFIILSIV